MIQESVEVSYNNLLGDVVRGLIVVFLRDRSIRFLFARKLSTFFNFFISVEKDGSVIEEVVDIFFENISM